MDRYFDDSVSHDVASGMIPMILAAMKAIGEAGGPHPLPELETSATAPACSQLPPHLRPNWRPLAPPFCHSPRHSALKVSSSLLGAQAHVQDETMEEDELEWRSAQVRRVEFGLAGRFQVCRSSPNIPPPSRSLLLPP